MNNIEIGGVENNQDAPKRFKCMRIGSSRCRLCQILPKTSNYISPFQSINSIHVLLGQEHSHHQAEAAIANNRLRHGSWVKPKSESTIAKTKTSTPATTTTKKSSTTISASPFGRIASTNNNKKCGETVVTSNDHSREQPKRL
mmetsp:Transcript_62006/g.151448  ORF Transcript_62006/g.151448 Transcript_62006/m.151448 type:complete len:143 (+) Transcript_62006:1999-2427(+)